MTEEKSRLPSAEPQTISFAGNAISCSVAVGSPTVWLTYSFAKDWFDDAFREATVGTDHHSRRREIIFAVCFAEAYLVEWVRDDVLNRDFRRLSEFFPIGDRSGPEEKWKSVPKLLRDAGLVRAAPDKGRGAYWDDFRTLVRMRNGLIHARSSRPETHGQVAEESPLPSKRDLDGLAPGWPVRVVVNLVQELHAAAGTHVPEWIPIP